MGALSRILRNVEGGKVAFRCPGCQCAHSVPVHITSAPLAVPDPEDPDWTPPNIYYEARDGAWSWNGSAEQPSFQPSILVRSYRWTPPVTHDNLPDWKRQPWPQHKVDFICHSYVTDGRIQFLGDCTHSFAGKTVDIPPWDADSQTSCSST